MPTQNIIERARKLEDGFFHYFQSLGFETERNVRIDEIEYDVVFTDKEGNQIFIETKVSKHINIFSAIRHILLRAKNVKFSGGYLGIYADFLDKKETEILKEYGIGLLAFDLSSRQVKTILEPVDKIGFSIKDKNKEIEDVKARYKSEKEKEFIKEIFIFILLGGLIMSSGWSLVEFCLILNPLSLINPLILKAIFTLSLFLLYLYYKFRIKKT